jgi:hypothetical protein
VVARLASRCHTGKGLAGVAVRTVVSDARVVHRRTTKIGESGHRMATLARRQSSRHVVRRLGHRCHTGEHLAVVAGIATADDPGVDHHCPGEVGELARRVAGLAPLAGRQVVARLGHGRHAGKSLAVVAGRAAAEDAGMDHHCPGEVGELARRVAGLARLAGRQVVTRFGYRGHAGKSLAVVAGRATADDTGVNHRRPGEVGEPARGVAGLAR